MCHFSCAEILPQTYFFSVESILDFCPIVSVSAPESLQFVLAIADIDELFKIAFVFNHSAVKEAQFFQLHLLEHSLF